MSHSVVSPQKIFKLRVFEQKLDSKEEIDIKTIAPIRMPLFSTFDSLCRHIAWKKHWTFKK